MFYKNEVTSLLVFIVVIVQNGVILGSVCKYPQLLQYQEISLVKTKNFSVYNQNYNFRYKCVASYHFIGDPTETYKIQCNNGQWEPKSLIPCVDSCENKCRTHDQCIAGKCHCDDCGKFGGKYCKERFCKAPQKPRHGSFSFAIHDYPSTACAVRVGTDIVYKCDTGYYIHTGSSRTVCTETEKGWRELPPVCEEYMCEPKETLSLKLHGSFAPMLPKYSTGKVVTFECNTGYELDGVSDIKCEINGYWKYDWPNCIAQTCKSVLLRHGMIEPPITSTNNSPRPLGTRLTFSCLAGYVLVGPQSITCRSMNTVKWSADPPICISHSQFSQRCREEGKIMEDDGTGKKICKEAPTGIQYAPATKSVISKTGKPLTIVTATAGGLLLLLLLVISIVACQRRRLSRMRRGRGGHQRLNSDDDRLSFVYYSNDVHVVLPSYDEAMRINHPPPYVTEDNTNRLTASTATAVAAAASAAASAMANNPATTTITRPTDFIQDGENIYESIDEISTNQQTLSTNTPPPVDSTDTSVPQDDTTPINSEGEGPEEGATANDTSPFAFLNEKMKTHDYTRYDGPPNEPIYASVQRILSNSNYLADCVLQGTTEVGNQDENEKNVEESDITLDSPLVSSDEDWNSDTEALLNNE